MSKKVNFTVLCPHCGKNLNGEQIIDESTYDGLYKFFYTESDHQLAYNGVRLESVHCLDTLDGTQ